MEKSVYTGSGKTTKEAFLSIWELMRYTDDYMCRRNGDKWEIKFSVIVPTEKERDIFEQP